MSKQNKHIDAEELKSIAEGWETDRKPKEIALAALELLKEQAAGFEWTRSSARTLLNKLEEIINCPE